MPKRSKEYMQAQRLRFCEAAVACFRRKGVTATNLTDICNESGLSMGALYKHFSSREDLLEAVLQLRLDHRDALLNGATWADLRAALVQYRRELEQNPFWREFDGVADWNKRLSQMRVKGGVFILGQMEGHLARFAAAGDIKPVFDLNRTAQLVSIVFDGSLTNVRSSSELSVDLADLAAYLDLVVGAQAAPAEVGAKPGSTAKSRKPAVEQPNTEPGRPRP